MFSHATPTGQPCFRKIATFPVTPRRFKKLGFPDLSQYQHLIRYIITTIAVTSIRSWAFYSTCICVRSIPKSGPGKSIPQLLFRENINSRNLNSRKIETCCSTIKQLIQECYHVQPDSITPGFIPIWSVLITQSTLKFPHHALKSAKSQLQSLRTTSM